jgi:hypothetical protein
MVITSAIWPEPPMIPIIVIIHHGIRTITKPWRIPPEWRVIGRISIVVRITVSVSIPIVRS